MPGLQGRIDEMYFYDRALSPDEIARLYAHTIKPVERLEMLAVSPIDGATDVARLSEVRISFSEALDPVTIGGAFELSVSGTPVPLYSVLGNGNRNVTLRTVSGSFAPDADYELRMSASLASLA